MVSETPSVVPVAVSISGFGQISGAGHAKDPVTPAPELVAAKETVVQVGAQVCADHPA